MFSFIYNTFVYNPLYNGLIGIVALIPGNDIGLAIIIFTILIKIALFPLSKKAILTQIKMKEVEPLLSEIKKKYANNKEELARQTMNVYKEKQVNPFSSFGVLLIQIPIVIALYQVFSSGGLPQINLEWLYSGLSAFGNTHQNVNMVFLGLINLAEKSIPLALLAGITQFIQAYLMSGSNAPSKDAQGFGADFSRTMHTQTLYVFPVLMAVAAWSISGAVALYLIVSNVMSIVQEFFLRKHRTPIS